MKRFTCDCTVGQFKNPNKVYIDFEATAAIPCLYKPNEKVTLRQIKLQTNFCPRCGAKLEEIK